MLDCLVCELCVWMSVSAVASMDDHGLEPALVRGTSMACHSDSRLLLQLHILIIFFPKTHRFHCCHLHSILAICSKL